MRGASSNFGGMKHPTSILPGCAFACGVLLSTSVQAEPHQATHLGNAAILREVVGLEHSAEVGNEVTRENKVTNQDASPGTNIRSVRTLPAAQEFFCGSGSSALNEQVRSITLETRSAFAPRAEVSRRFFVKAAQAADERFKVELRTNQFTQSITEDESTQPY